MQVNARPASGNYIACLKAENFLENAQGTFISEKELRKKEINYRSRLLSYGDYLFIIKGNEVKIVRYEQPTGTTLVGEDIYVISAQIGIVENYLGYEKNRAYIVRSIKEALATSAKDVLTAIGEIEINTDNIRELEESNLSEQYGIRKPLDRSVLPLNLTDKVIPLDKLMKRIDNGELLLDTEFQRRAGLWDIGTKSRLIEALIINQPIPAFYFDGADNDQWLVIDGLQRLSAVHDFINDKFELDELDYLADDLTGKKFSALERSYRRNIEEFQIFAYIAGKGTPKSVIYKIFKNINTSALKLEGQEIRHAINPGAPSKILKEIAKSEWFKNAVPISDRLCDRMYDREAVLRFLAFKIVSYKEYKPTMPDFLDDVMVRLNDEPQQKLREYQKDLRKILQDIYDTFDMAVFSRSAFDGSNSPYKHNNILFELLTYAYSKNRRLGEQKENSKIQLSTFFQNRPPNFWDNEQAYSQNGLISRFEEMEKFITTIK